jgi:lysozyme
MNQNQRSASIKALIASVALATGISANTLTVTVNEVEELEGLSTTAYADMADPSLATACYGETEGIHFGDEFTPEECEVMLIKRLPDYIKPVKAAIPNAPDNRLIAYSLASWNLGRGLVMLRTTKCIEKKLISGECVKRVVIPGTSIADLEDAGNWQAACDRLHQFDRAGGKKIRGLAIRREKEYRICMGYLHGQQTQ